MTTISGTAAQTRPADRLLRVALKVDAIASGLTGLGFVGTPKMVKDLFGLPLAVTIPVGVFLLLFAVGVWITASRQQIIAPAVVAIIVLNIASVAATITVLAGGWLPLTTLGIGYTILQGIAVAAFAEFEFIGLRKANRGK